VSQLFYQYIYPAIFRIAIHCASLWLSTLRIHWVDNQYQYHGCIFALWHEQLPSCIRVFGQKGIGVLISQSSDGNIAALLCKNMGYRVFRGSSSRGGVSGLKSLIRYLQLSDSGHTGGMALDGPHGPYHTIGPGTLWLSSRLVMPVVPVDVIPGWFFRLNTWDKTQIPLPFSTIYVKAGKGIMPENTQQLRDAMYLVRKENASSRRANNHAPAEG
jgi:lysophospholipid acyltransferase (LPLAT)-like uncharacterized protein